MALGGAEFTFKVNNDQPKDLRKRHFTASHTEIPFLLALIDACGFRSVLNLTGLHTVSLDCTVHSQHWTNH